MQVRRYKSQAKNKGSRNANRASLEINIEQRAVYNISSNWQLAIEHSGLEGYCGASITVPYIIRVSTEHWKCGLLRRVRDSHRVKTRLSTCSKTRQHVQYSGNAGFLA